MNASDSNEQISAFVDGELRGPARGRVVDALYGSPALCRTWTRYHLIGDAARNVGPVPGAGSIAGNVSAALSREPVVPFTPRPRRPWLIPLPGLAIAAAVAMVAILGIRGLEDGGAQSPPIAGASRDEAAEAARLAAASDPAASPAPPVASIALRSVGSEAIPARWSDVAPDAEARLNVYLVQHNEYAGNGVRGVLPYVRIVGYQPMAGDDR